MNNQYEKVYYCPRCKANEWCRVWETAEAYSVSALVCGKMSLIKKALQKIV